MNFIKINKKKNSGKKKKFLWRRKKYLFFSLRLKILLRVRFFPAKNVVFRAWKNHETGLE
jgi:hypothetical protein